MYHAVMSGDEQIALARHPFVTAVETALRTRCGAEQGWRLLAAVSGGADSVAMLLSLHSLAERPHWQLDLHVGHANHHLRPQADEDARFVRDLADRLKLPFHSCDIRPADRPGNLEANARQLRYESLARIAAEIDADAIVTAHHADDQLETMLMRLARGSSVNGLAGIAPRRRLHDRLVIRPMLQLDHAQAEQFCRDMNQDWREDHTNRNADRWRNRLRAEVLPVLRQLRPDAATKADDTAQQLRQAAAMVENHVRQFIRRHVRETPAGECVMDRDTARRTPTALLSATLHRLAARMGVREDQLAGRVIGQITAASKDRSGEARRFDLAAGVKVHVDASKIRIFAGTP